MTKIAKSDPPLLLDDEPYLGIAGKGTHITISLHRDIIRLHKNLTKEEAIHLAYRLLREALGLR